MPEVTKFWSVKINLGDTEGELVWGREEPAELVSEGQIIQLGDDRRPYWVSFLMGTNVLRIIDLVSGKLVINTTLNLAPVTEPGRYALLSLRLKEDSDIPAVFIFDRSGAKLIKLELEVLPSS